VNLVNFDPNLSLAGLADDANVHPYAYGNTPIGSVIDSNYQRAFGSTSPGPRVITETGYTTDPNAARGVTGIEQAQQIVNGLFDAYQSGVSTTYLYELLDEKTDPSNANSEMHFGLFNFDNTPKPAAIAIHNLTTILADSASHAANFQTGHLDYTETGATSADHSMLMEKSTGEFDLALWNDAAAGTAQADPVTVTFSQPYQNVIVHDVITNSTTNYANVSKVSLNLGGDAMIIEVDPNQSASLLDVTAAITANAINEIRNMPFIADTNNGVSDAAPADISAALLSVVSPAAVMPAIPAEPLALANSGGGYFADLLSNHANSSVMAMVASLIDKAQP
jgi:hypothetical protein